MQCEASGISFKSIEKQTDGNSKIYSSSSIRDFISQGDIVNATTFLGYYWYVKGLVIKGQNKGTDMGFPTVNLRLNKSINLAHGIYATNIYFNGHKYGSASYFGTRPTFNGDEEFLETYIFDFNDDLYGKAVDIVIKQQKVSTSYIQRYLQIGYNRAARIVEKMEEDGIISEANNAGKRHVLKK